MTVTEMQSNQDRLNVNLQQLVEAIDDRRRHVYPLFLMNIAFAIQGIAKEEKEGEFFGHSGAEGWYIGTIIRFFSERGMEDILEVDVPDTKMKVMNFFENLYTEAKNAERPTEVLSIYMKYATLLRATFLSQKYSVKIESMEESEI